MTQNYEHSLILPGTGMEGSKFVAEKARKAIEDLCIPHLHSSVCSHLTMSIGGITSMPRAGLSSLDLIKKADQLLYSSKKHGKNMVSWLVSADADPDNQNFP